jgi:hypothetical protein
MRPLPVSGYYRRTCYCSAKTLDLYAGRTRFESRPSCRLFWTTASTIRADSPGECTVARSTAESRTKPLSAQQSYHFIQHYICNLCSSNSGVKQSMYQPRDMNIWYASSKRSLSPPPFRENDELMKTDSLWHVKTNIEQRRPTSWSRHS